MAKVHPSKELHVRIEGGVSGQVAIGDNILQIGEIHGGIVNILAPEKKPNFMKRDAPVYLRPRAFPGLLDREAEQRTAIGAIQVTESLSLNGADGIGKTALLRYLAYNSPGDNFPDGIIYLSARGYGVDDLQQYIFEAFYESDSPSKPTNAQLNQFLQNLKALILLDDIALEYAEAAQLINNAPQCAFIFSSAERSLWGEGYCIELGGLPLPESVTLLERELKRPVSGQEMSAAQDFCRAVNGHPLYIIQGAALVQHGVALAELTNRFRESEDVFVKSLLAKLTASQRQVISLLAASGASPIPAQHLASLCQGLDLENALKTLLDLKLIQAHSPAYSLAGSLASPIGRITDLGGLEDRLLDYFVGWIKQNPPLPDVTDALDLLLRLLEKSNRDHRWDDVISIGRGIEKALILGKRWSAWARVLEMILKAAQALGNRAAQGWAFHQLGTRDLCLGNLDPARQSLTQALKIREALGDKAGAAVTRHNLNLIAAPPAPPRDTPRSGPKPAPKGGASPIIKLFFTLLIITAIAAATIILWPDLVSPPPPNEAVPAAATKPQPQPPSIIKPPTRTPTKTPTKTITPSPTLPPCRPGVWYCEDFNDGQAQFWELESGWSVRGDALNGAGHKFAILTDHEWSDYRVTFDLNVNEGTIHLNYRLTPAANGFNRYFIGVEASGISLSRQINDTFTPLISKGWRYPSGEWHRFEIAGWGGHIVIYVDGKMELNHVDEDYIRNGTIAFETLDNSSARIDNIEVTGAGDEPPVQYNPPSDYVPPTEEPPVNVIPPAPLPVTCTSVFMTWEEFTDRPGLDYWSGTHTGGIDSVPISAEKCQDMCLNDTYCMAFTYDTYLNQCWLKSGQPDPVYKYQDISGIKVCQ